ncbi:MAG: hypothetical protein JWR43_1202, partial [Phenylobacterium sp.]|nr:hypothetical protein [Phenylobacterium sp.]
MKTDELIQSLTGELAPVAPGAVARRIAAGLGVGVLVSAGVMLAWLGLRPDFAQAVSTPMFWMKFGYAAATGLILAALLTRLAKPAVRPGALAAMAAAPLAVVAAMALFRFANAPPERHRALLMGHSSSACPWRILVIGLPL